MARAAGPVSVAEALEQARAALIYLGEADWASLPGQVQRDALEELAHLQTRHIAARTGVLSAFDAGNGYRFDGCAGPVPWLTSVTRISKAAAKEQAGWLRTFRDHPEIAQALAAGAITDSYGRAFAAWTGRLPAEDRDGADEILIDAAVAGLEWEDIARLAREMYERSRTLPDDDGDQPFKDRQVRVERTFGGAGRLTGDLSPEVAEQLQKIFAAFGKRVGPDDLRSEGERCHDAIGEAFSRLLKANLAPQSSGMDTKVMVNIPLAYLRQLPGSQALEDTWIEARIAESGWLSGPGGDAAACASEVTPVVTGTVDWDALDTLTRQWLEAAEGRKDCQCNCGGRTCRTPLTPEARLRLSRTLLRLAADAVSGPAGLAGFLRSRQLGAPYNGASLPLDIGQSKDIPEYIRRAVIRRDRGCAWPGCGKPPGACEPHHLIPRSEGGQTDLGNLKLFCWHHHHVCIHRDGWKVTAHPDGTVTARAPWGTEAHTGQLYARTA